MGLMKEQPVSMDCRGVTLQPGGGHLALGPVGWNVAGQLSRCQQLNRTGSIYPLGRVTSANSR